MLSQTTMSDHLEAIERRNNLIVENQGLIHRVIQKHFPRLASMVGYDEVFQTAIIHALREADRWNPERAKFSTYLTLVVRSRLTDWQSREFRDRKRFSTVSRSLDGPSSAHNPSTNLNDYVDGRHDAEVLIENVNDLEDAGQRRAITLFYGLNGSDPKTCREVADAMGASVGRVRDLLAEGKEMLRWRMGVAA